MTSGGRLADAGHGELPVARRVRAARLARGLTLRELARRLGVSPATVSQLETGKTGMSIGRLSQIATVLDTPVVDLLVEPPPDAEPVTVAGGWRAYSDEGRDPVLAAAVEAFAETGYHAASVRSIALRSGLSVPGLYHHYPSKQDLLVSILEGGSTELLERAADARAEGRDCVERCSLLVENLALYHAHRHRAAFVQATEMRSLLPANRGRIVALRDGVQRMIRDEVDAAVDAGRFAADRPHEACRAAIALCTAIPQWYRPGGPLAPAAIARHHVEFALDLLRYRPTGR